AATIPASRMWHQGRTKHIFIQSLRGLLPDEILDRSKKGFGIPLNRWFRGPLRPLVRELLLSEACRKRPIFHEAYLQRLISRQEQGRPLDFHMWTLMSFELWCRTFLDRKCSPPTVRSTKRAAAAAVRPATKRRPLPARSTL